MDPPSALAPPSPPSSSAGSVTFSPSSACRASIAGEVLKSICPVVYTHPKSSSASGRRSLGKGRRSIRGKMGSRHSPSCRPFPSLAGEALILGSSIRASLHVSAAVLMTFRTAAVNCSLWGLLAKGLMATMTSSTTVAANVLILCLELTHEKAACRVRCLQTASRLVDLPRRHSPHSLKRLSN